MKHLKQVFLSLVASFAIVGCIQAKSYDITAYMGDAHVYVTIAEKDGSSALSTVACDSAETGINAGNPAAWLTNSPVYAFACAFERAVEQLDIDTSVQNPCRLFISGDGCGEKYHQRGGLWEDEVPVIEPGDNDFQMCPKVVEYTIDLIRKADLSSRGCYFRSIFQAILARKGLQNTNSGFWLMYDSCVMGQVAQFFAGKKQGSRSPVKNVDVLHVATCITPYQVRNGFAPKGLRLPQGHSSQWKVGQQLIDTYMKTNGADLAQAPIDTNTLLLEAQETMVKVINYTFDSIIDLAYKAPNRALVLPFIYIIGELAWVLPNLPGCLEHKSLETCLNIDRLGRLEFVSRDDFMQLLHKAGCKEMNRLNASSM